MSAPTIEIRPTEPTVAARRLASDTFRAALLHPPTEDSEWEKRTDSWDESDSLTAWAGDRPVGHVAGFRFDTLVPGGAWLATNGVTRVGVLPTHRRRGVASQLLTRLLTEARERGQVLASLRASDTRIYGRYGFGLAGVNTQAEVDATRALPIGGATTDGSLRLVAPDQVVDTVATLYPRCAGRVGVLRRPRWLTARYVEAATEAGGDAEFVVVHTSADGVDDGYAHYGVKWDDAPFTNAVGKGTLYEVWATTPGVELALWDYLCNIDLVTEWFCEERPIDDVLQYAVNDSRAYRIKRVWDEQWLRLLDVDAALSARTYNAGAGSFTLGVHDAMFPVNDGVWEISSAGAERLTGGADPEVAAAVDTADLVVDVREASAAYLGGTRWTALAAAGRVTANDPAALAIADTLFVTTPAPFCNSGF